jgi:manganese transport protein
VLYGTIFAATAAHSRLFADMCRVMGLYARDDYRRRLQYRRGFVVLLTVLPAVLFLLIVSPVQMVVAGGIVQSVMLPVVGFGTLYLRYRRLPAELAPSAAVTAGLWVASAVMLGATAVYARSVFWP